jgi:hypothetical protein
MHYTAILLAKYDAHTARGLSRRSLRVYRLKVKEVLATRILKVDNGVERRAMWLYDILQVLPTAIN